MWNSGPRARSDAVCGHGVGGPLRQIGSVVLNVADVSRAAAFWRGALGYVPREGSNLGALVPRTGEGPPLLLDETDTTHLDLHVASEEKQQAEVERLISLGAQRVDWVYPDGANFVVLSDTEGNLFCVEDTSRG
jgi:catechol 2,3-dioxygenase-like lactoylglutathione lyase family enzyme